MRSADLAKKLKDHPYSQAAFLAGQLGQVRPQKTVDAPAQAHAQAGEAQAGEVQAPAPEVPGEVARDAPVEPPPAPILGGAEMPYPGYVLPDDAPPVEAAPFSASMPLSAPPSVAEGGDVSMPPASGALGSGLGAQGSGAPGSAGSSAAAPTGMSLASAYA